MVRTTGSSQDAAHNKRHLGTAFTIALGGDTRCELIDGQITPKAMASGLHSDIAGWKRDRIAENPMGFPARDIPDWACEVSWTTWKKDMQTIPETLSMSGVQSRKKEAKNQ